MSYSLKFLNTQNLIVSLFFSLVIFFILFWLYGNFIYSDDFYERNNLSADYPALSMMTEDTERVKQGEYLAKIGNCITCHTDKASGNNVFAGGLMINTPFGHIPSTNITPDKETGIGNWSEKDFVRAMQKGISPTGKNYYPAFPYLYFSNLTASDLKSLYLYFKSIPAIHKENQSASFPLNVWGFRKLVKIWNFFGFRAKPQRLPASKSQELQIGAYIVNGLAHCGMCHTNINSFGVPKPENFLSGAFAGGFWAPSINQLGLENIDKSELTKVFKDGLLMNNAGPLAGPMADVTHNSLQFLTQRDASAIATYLKRVKSKPVLSISPELSKRAPPTLKRGKDVYFQVCLVCHQTGRVSAPRVGASGSWYNRIKNEGIETLYQRTIDGFNNMPRLGACVNCTNNDIISAVNYMLKESLTPSQWRYVQYKQHNARE